MPIKNLAKVLVLNDTEQVLLLRRSDQDEDNPGRLDFPGGGVDEGEQPLQAAVRELLEETGITADAEDLRLIYCKTTFSERKQMSINRMLYVVRVHGVTVRLSHEHSDHQWVDKTQVSTAFPHEVYGVAADYALKYGLL